MIIQEGFDINEIQKDSKESVVNLFDVALFFLRAT